ncbi:hypothetical protein [Paraburkholderia sp. J8-2]|uniref:hypothetical protein n=1 Tax=Paraburkholderia sp. J8-2 TaxID=2805440 RepID=UPI002AB7B818|nr:hypothetical protein [Paraburkholderia sp. J8-2]
MSNNNLTHAVQFLQSRLEMLLLRQSLSEVEFSIGRGLKNENEPTPEWMPQQSGIIKPTLEELVVDGLTDLATEQYQRTCSELDQIRDDLNNMLGHSIDLIARLAREGTVYPMRFQLRLLSHDGQEVHLNTLVNSR